MASAAEADASWQRLKDTGVWICGRLDDLEKAGIVTTGEESDWISADGRQWYERLVAEGFTPNKDDVRGLLTELFHDPTHLEPVLELVMRWKPDDNTKG